MNKLFVAAALIALSRISGQVVYYAHTSGTTGASPNQIKPVHVIGDERLKRFFFGILQT